MRLSEFILLDEKAKKELLLSQAVLVAKRKTEQYCYFLFQWDRFYVELVGNGPLKSIERFTVFNDLNGLQPYLDTIAMNDILPE